MCDFSALSGFLTSLGLFAGFAATSAVFALMWARFGDYPPVVSICFSFAAAWALSAGIMVVLAKSAMTTFCACASRVATCSSACDNLKSLLIALMVSLAILLGTSLAMGAEPLLLSEQPALVVALILSAAATSVGVGLLGYVGSKLSTCQA